MFHSISTKPLNSWQAREMSEKAILYPHPSHGHSSKEEESDKLGPGLLGRVAPERAAARIITKDRGFWKGARGAGGILPVQSVWGVRVAWGFPLKHFNTSVVTLRCDQARK